MDNLTAPQAIGQRVETLRKRKGISRRKFALTVKTPLTSYRDRELGRLDFDLPQLRRISVELDVSVSYLVTGIIAAAALEELAAAESLAA